MFVRFMLIICLAALCFQGNSSKGPRTAIRLEKKVIVDDAPVISLDDDIPGERNSNADIPKFMELSSNDFYNNEMVKERILEEVTTKKIPSCANKFDSAQDTLCRKPGDGGTTAMQSFKDSNNKQWCAKVFHRQVKDFSAMEKVRKSLFGRNPNTKGLEEVAFYESMCGDSRHKRAICNWMPEYGGKCVSKEDQRTYLNIQNIGQSIFKNDAKLTAKARRNLQALDAKIGHTTATYQDSTSNKVWQHQNFLDKGSSTANLGFRIESSGKKFKDAPIEGLEATFLNTPYEALQCVSNELQSMLKFVQDNAEFRNYKLVASSVLCIAVTNEIWKDHRDAVAKPCVCRMIDFAHSWADGGNSYLDKQPSKHTMFTYYDSYKHGLEMFASHVTGLAKYKEGFEGLPNYPPLSGKLLNPQAKLPQKETKAGKGGKRKSIVTL